VTQKPHEKNKVPPVPFVDSNMYKTMPCRCAWNSSTWRSDL